MHVVRIRLSPILLDEIAMLSCPEIRCIIGLNTKLRVKILGEWKYSLDLFRSNKNSPSFCLLWKIFSRHGWLLISSSEFNPGSLSYTLSPGN